MEELKTFLIEIARRPDGVVNSTINSYSTEAVTRAMFHQRVATAITSTQFVTVCLKAIDEQGGIIEEAFVRTQYAPTEE
jgi:hypothetical protein